MFCFVVCLLLHHILFVIGATLTPGNLVVVRIGNGASKLQDFVAVPVFLDEYALNGSLIQSIRMVSKAYFWLDRAFLKQFLSDLAHCGEWNESSLNVEQSRLCNVVSIDGRQILNACWVR